MRKNIATSSLLPGTSNVHSLAMAREWLASNNMPIPSAIDREKQRRGKSL